MEKIAEVEAEKKVRKLFSQPIPEEVPKSDTTTRISKFVAAKVKLQSNPSYERPIGHVHSIEDLLNLHSVPGIRDQLK